MTDFFEIIQKPKRQQKHLELRRNNIKEQYERTRQKFIDQSYGYYTEHFIEQFYEKVQEDRCFLLSFNIKSLLRRVTKSFMLNDLQLIFFVYFANKNEWNFGHNSMKKQYLKVLEKISKSVFEEENQTKIELFMFLIAYFVKKYVGKIDEVQILHDYFNLFSEGEWQVIYENWKQSNKAQKFAISPRQINALYGQFSKNCQQKTIKKNYNNMVDRILELSTTYSIMPQNEFEPKNLKGKKRRKLNQEGSVEIIEMDNDKRKKQLESLPFFQQRKRESSKQQSQKDIVNINLTSNPSKQKKSVTLKNKSKPNISHSINGAVTNYFQGKSATNEQLDELRLDSAYGGFNQLSYLDFNRSMRSDKYESIPYPLRSNSNLSKLI